MRAPESKGPMNEMQMVAVSLGGERREVPASEWQTAADELHAKHGGTPSVTNLDGSPLTPNAAPTPAQDEPAPAPALAVRRGGSGLSLVQPGAARPEIVSESGKARSERDKAAAEAAGFAVRAPLYDRGTIVDETGVANARASRSDWESMPTVAAACDGLIGRIAAENRQDQIARLGELLMTDAGQFVGLGGPDEHKRYDITLNAFGSLVSRLGVGGARYLATCWPELRAHNVNAWLQKLAAEDAAKELLMRTREGAEIFAVVSPSYTRFDCDKMAEAVKLAASELGGHARVTYDGERARVECLWHSDIQPEDYVAGEFFKAGVIVKSDDTGGGALRGSSVVWQNLCRNLIILDKASMGEFSIRHTASVEEMARRFRAGFEQSLKSIEHFRAAWGFACRDNLAESVPTAGQLAARELMAGIFRAQLADERIPIPVAASKREVVVSGLMAAWDADTSASAGKTTRAAVVNAVTRYAHQTASLDPWAEDDLQSAAGALVFGKRPLRWAPRDEE